MIITVFGATGMVGKKIVRQALNMGHRVKAFGRNVFTAGFHEEESLQLIPGALFDENAVYQAVKGSDVVLSALGGATDGVDQTRSLGMKNIVQQMEKAGVKRIIAIGGMGVLDAEDDGIIMEKPGYPKEYLAVGKEHYKAFEWLKNSDLNWTFIGSPDIVDQDETGTFFTAADTLPSPNQFKINAGDLALFMLIEMERNAFLKKKVGISN